MELIYNLEHQMTTAEVTKNSITQNYQYAYDPFGRRVSKTDSFATTYFSWDGNRLLSQSKGTKEQTYIYEQDGFVPVATLDQENNINYYHTDHLGTPQEVTNTKGEIVWEAEYTTWGNTAKVTYKQIDSKIADDIEFQPLRFQGQYYDSETGLHYNRFRYYDPDVGRFTTQEPIGLLGGDNLYMYAPNPMGWVDPLGLAKKKNCEFIVRVMSKDEASKSKKGLNLKKGHSGAKWVSEGETKQPSLGKKGHEVLMTMEIEKGTIKWLKKDSIDFEVQDGGEASCPDQVFTKSNEKRAFGIGKNLVDKFNSKITKITFK